MTPRTAAQPQMSVEEFEELARRAPELVRLEGAYRSATTRPFGAVVELPGPVGFPLDTEKLKAYAD